MRIILKDGKIITKSLILSKVISMTTEGIILTLGFEMIQN